MKRKRKDLDPDLLEYRGGDTPSEMEVLQREAEEDPGIIPPVDVNVLNVVRMDQMPRMIGASDSLELATDSGAIRLLGEDPRRAEVIIWCTTTDIIICGNRGAAEQRQGAVLSSGLPIPVRIQTQSEIWVRIVDGAAEAAIVNFISEMWSR